MKSNPTTITRLIKQPLCQWSRKLSSAHLSILLSVQELLTLVNKMENEREKDLIIESRFHRQLIGPKGETIQKMRDDFASVQVGKSPFLC